jgi:hypothetical protein
MKDFGIKDLKSFDHLIKIQLFNQIKSLLSQMRSTSNPQEDIKKALAARGTTFKQDFVISF